MDSGDSDAMNGPVPPEPFALPESFALIAGSSNIPAGAAEMERTLRRIGLQPRRVDGAAPLWRLRFGSATVLAGPAPEAALDAADPAHPATSQLASSLPGDWRTNGRCWMFAPEIERAADAPSMPPAPMREFFKMMVLLIDLFDADHYFWSPALLWSDAVQFRASVAEMLASGMPPVLHLVAFRRREAGDGEWVATRGLAIFAGQELESRVPAGWTTADMVQRLARLALDIILNGPVSGDIRARGLHRGERMAVSPLAGGGDGHGRVLVEFSRDG